MESSQLFLNAQSFDACNNYCNDTIFGPPPDDILFMPPPPLPPSVQSFLMPQRNLALEDSITTHAIDSKCNYCSIFDNGNNFIDSSSVDPSRAINSSDYYLSQSRAGLLLIAIIFIVSALVTLAYFSRTRKMKLFASHMFGQTSQTSSVTSSSKSSSNGSPHPHNNQQAADACLMPMNMEKTLSSPNILTDVPHKKTSIPSKYWAQPSQISRETMEQNNILTMQNRRIPNDYEVPSSRTNSTCTSSAVYADLTCSGANVNSTMNINHKAQSQTRLFSPYNMHTYAEVLEPTMGIESSNNKINNKIVIMPDSNYDNAVYSHGSIITSNGLISNGNIINGSLQLTDFGTSQTSGQRQQMSGPYNVNNAPIIYHQQQLYQQQHPIRQFTTLHNQQQQQQQHLITTQGHRAQTIVVTNNKKNNQTICRPSLLNNL